MNIQNVVTQNLIETALSHQSKEKIKVMGYSLESVVPTGDNYTSDLFRASVTYCTDKLNKKESITIIVKCSPQGGIMEELAKRMNLFSNEIEMFTKTLPSIYKVLDEKATLSSDLIFALLENPSILILEDLRPLNFVMHKRQIGFNLEHCLMVLKNLAKFHAASVVMADEDPSLVKNYNQGIYGDDEMVCQWILSGFEGLSEAALTWPNYENYGKKLKKLGNKALIRGQDAGKRKCNGFNVLNHGDLWTNNVMFHYDNNEKLTDMKFIDFQLIKYSSPAIDLHYFLATSPTDKVREKHFELLLEYYYGNLLTNLAKLQYSLEKVPTLKEFKQDFKDRAFYGLMAASTVAPLVKSSHRNDANFEQLMLKGDENCFRHHCYNNERYRCLMEHLLPYYDSLGILD